MGKIVIDAPFVPALTVDELIRRIGSDCCIDAERRRSLVTLLRTAARQFGTPPDLLPFDTALLERLATVAPKRHRISKGHLFNVRGAVRYGLAYHGVEFVRGRDLSPPSAAWKALLDGLVDNPEKSTLIRAARWFTRQDTEPATVTLADIEAFRAGLVAGDVRGAAKATWWRLVNGWTKALATVPGWPVVAIPVRRWPNCWTTKNEDLPEPLAGEIAAMLAWAQDDDPLADLDDPFAIDVEDWRPLTVRRAVTVKGWDYALRAYISTLRASGVGLDRLNSLAALVEPAMLKLGLSELLKRSPTGNRRRVFNTVCILKTIARDYLRLDAERVAAIGRICRRLQPKEDGLTAKNREPLAIFKDKRRLRELVQLPQRLMQRALAAAEDDDGPKPARMAQLAVAIEIFLMAPMRIGNLIRLRLDRHISPLAIKDGQATIALPPEEMKNGKALDYFLDRDSCELVQTYLSRFRARLAEPGNSFLFPGKVECGHKHLVVLRNQITTLMRDELGATWHPHLFRHLAAGLYLEENPGEYETVRRLLGHARLKTTVRYYAGTEMVPAVRQYHKTVLLHRPRQPAVARGRAR